MIFWSISRYLQWKSRGVPIKVTSECVSVQYVSQKQLLYTLQPLGMEALSFYINQISNIMAGFI